MSEAEWVGDVLAGGAAPQLEPGPLSASPQPSLESSPKAVSPRESPQFSPRGNRAPGLPNDHTTLTAPAFQATAGRKSRGSPGGGTKPQRTQSAEKRIAGAGFTRGPRDGQPDDTVSKLTTRIRQLEGELENAFDALSSRQPPAAKRVPRRSGSAPPARRRPLQAPAQASATSPSTRRPPESPQVAPRIMCRETLGESEGTPNLDTGTLLLNAVEGQRGLFRTEAGTPAAMEPSRLWHICQMMQLERRGFLEALQDVCKKCNLEFEESGWGGTVQSWEDAQLRKADAGGASQACEALADAVEGSTSPRKLLTRLCDAHLALRARAAVAGNATDACDRQNAAPGNAGNAECEDVGLAAVEASPRDDFSLQYSATPASPPDGLLLDSPWTTNLRVGGLVDVGGTGNQGGNPTKVSTERPFAAAAAQLRSLLDSSDGDVGEYAALTQEALEELWDLLDVARHAESVFAPLRPASPSPETEAVLPGGDSADTIPIAMLPADSSLPSFATPPVSMPSGRQPGTPQSSVGSLPAVGRLCELVDEKRREVAELQARCDSATSSEEHLEASTLLAAAREELRLLREFLGEGVDQGLGQRSGNRFASM